MDVSVTAAKAQLTELVRRAEKGEVVTLTRHGRPAARIVPAGDAARPRLRREIIDEITRRAAAEAAPGPDAAHDHDFLYDESGLPK